VVEHWEDEVVDDVVVRDVVGHIDVMVCVVVYVDVEHVDEGHVMVCVVVYVDVEHVDEGHVMVVNSELDDVEVLLEDVVLGGIGVEVVVVLEVEVVVVLGVEVVVVLEVEVVVVLGVEVVVVLGTAPQRPALLMWSVSNVTAALSAMKEPLLEDPVVTVMAVRATTFPVNTVPVPIVAELPICQKILHGRPPLIT